MSQQGFRCVAGIAQSGVRGLEMTRSEKYPERNDEADVKLMARVASDDEQAVAELYDRFGPLVYRMAYQASPSKAEAEDAVQEVFVRLWKTADRFDPKKAALVTWIMLIARRQLVDRLRRSQARLRASASLDETMYAGQVDRSAGAESLDEQERFKVLLERVAELPELQRTVVTRAYLGGQTLRQIGEELGAPIGTIKSALSRALVRLRERGSEELPT